MDLIYYSRLPRKVSPRLAADRDCHLHLPAALESTCLKKRPPRVFVSPEILFAKCLLARFHAPRQQVSRRGAWTCASLLDNTSPNFGYHMHKLHTQQHITGSPRVC